MSEVLELKGISKQYPSGVTALHDTNLVIPAEKLTSLLGPSGCGKTTLLRIIAGLEPQTAGQLLIDGKDCDGDHFEHRPVGMVFQSYALFPHMDVLGNVAYGLRMTGDSAAFESARGVLKDIGLSGKENADISTLSGGQQQRVALARALVLKPRILLLDEPLSNLDSAWRRHIRDDIRKLQVERKLTVLYVTHDQNEAMAVSDHVIVMNEGRIVQSGSPETVYENPNSEFVARFMGDVSIFDVEVDRDGVVDLCGLKVLTDVKRLVATRARLFVRPNAWRMGYAASTGLAGRVVRRTYLGRTTEYLVETGVGLIYVFDRGDAVQREVDSPVSLYLNTRGVSIVIPSGEDAFF